MDVETGDEFSMLNRLRIENNARVAALVNLEVSIFPIAGELESPSNTAISPGFPISFMSNASLSCRFNKSTPTEFLPNIIKSSTQIATMTHHAGAFVDIDTMIRVCLIEIAFKRSSNHLFQSLADCF